MTDTIENRIALFLQDLKNICHAHGMFIHCGYKCAEGPVVSEAWEADDIDGMMEELRRNKR